MVNRAGTPNASSPIGVFDSGIGGLTVVRALMKQLPHEQLIYFGDTARVPYGPKSPETVQRYALQIADWLVAQQVKAIVIACNTATAHALDAVRNAVDIPVVGVIEPGARAAVDVAGARAIGVIGTAGTIASHAYDRAIHALSPNADVRGIACPIFVPLVEEGWVEHPATRLVAEEYLAPLRNSGVGTLVLGCTHYPLLSGVIANAVGTNVRLIDSAEETARETASVLARASLLSSESTQRTNRFVASDAPDRFLATGRRFLGDAITDVELVTFT